MFQIPKAGNARLPSRLPLGHRIDFSPKNLFANSEPGVWFEANDANTLFTDTAGTTPVTAPGDAVALQLDKSQGLTLGPELADTSVVSVDAATGTVVGSQAVLVSASTFYEVAVTISNYVSGSVRLEFKSGQNTDYFDASETFILTPGAFGNVQFRTLGTTDLDVAISVRELPGNHRTQATVAARPLYALHPVGGVRNLLQYTEEFDNAVWTKEKFGAGTAPVVTSNAALAPDGTMTAERVVFTLPSGATVSDSSQLVQDFTFADATYAGSIYIKSNTGADQDIILIIRNSQVATVTATSEWQRISGSLVATAAPSNFGLRARGTFTAETVDLLVWGAQLEEGSTATAYQRVGSFLDVSEEGKARRGRIWYNGTSHFMQTGTITPGTDKVQVFAGVRKLSDAAAALLCEFSASVTNPANEGSFYVAAPESTSIEYTTLGRGSNGSGPTLRADFDDPSAAAPDSAVLTATHDIAGDLSRIRRNGVYGVDATGDKGTGNFLAYPLYFGARNGTGIRFNGYEDTSIVRFGPNLDATAISKVESYVASKTPEETI